jgi:hypothetical protein
MSRWRLRVAVLHAARLSHRRARAIWLANS